MPQAYASVDRLSKLQRHTLYLDANKSETEPLVDNAVAVFRSRLLPGYTEYFPGSGAKIPGHAATGIRSQPIDELAYFRAELPKKG